MKWKSSHIQQNSTFDHGLNSVMDSPLGQIPSFSFRSKIKCRSFHRNSVLGPDLTELPISGVVIRKSPRLHATSSIPMSPAPPLIPVAPPLPPLPSSIISHTKASHPPLPLLLPSSSMDHSRDILNQMQLRLRSRIRNKAAGRDGAEPVEGGGNSPGHIDGKGLDAKSRQWAEIQAHSRRIPLAEFLSLAEENKKELRDVLVHLDASLPSTVQGITEVVELLQAGTLWFPGGNKEMRESLPLYRKLEKKLEILTEYVQVCEEMEEVACSSKCARKKEPSGHADLYAYLHRIRDEFDVKHRHWGTIISSHAQSWTSVGLPACLRLLAKSNDHLCGLVCSYISLCLDEASCLHGILLSIKCTRTEQLKEKLKECLRFLLDAYTYFVQDYSNYTSCLCHLCSSQSERDFGLIDSGNGSSNSSVCHDVLYDRTRLLSMVVDVVLMYGNISLQQFDGYVLHFGRQGVCEHFEGILKMVSLVKSILMAVFSTKVSVRNSSGFISLFPDSMEFGGVLYGCCEKLVQHIVGRAQSVGISGYSPSSKQKLSKEMILWMMFGCKYIHQCLEFLGTEQAQQLGLCSLLLELQHTEDLL